MLPKPWCIAISRVKRHRPSMDDRCSDDVSQFKHNGASHWSQLGKLARFDVVDGVNRFLFHCPTWYGARILPRQPSQLR